MFKLFKPSDRSAELAKVQGPVLLVVLTADGSSENLSRCEQNFRKLLPSTGANRDLPVTVVVYENLLKWPSSDLKGYGGLVIMLPSIDSYRQDLVASYIQAQHQFITTGSMHSDVYLPPQFPKYIRAARHSIVLHFAVVYASLEILWKIAHDHRFESPMPHGTYGLHGETLRDSIAGLRALLIPTLKGVVSLEALKVGTSSWRAKVQNFVSYAMFKTPNSMNCVYPYTIPVPMLQYVDDGHLPGFADADHSSPLMSFTS